MGGHRCSKSIQVRALARAESLACRRCECGLSLRVRMLRNTSRRLVELGLTVRTKPKQAPAKRADRAKELAAKAIDSLTVEAPG
jgi:hypothetical protein